MNTTTTAATPPTMTSETSTSGLDPLLSALDSMSITAAIDEFDDLDGRQFLMPEASVAQLRDKVAQISLSAQRLGIHRASELVTEQQRLLEDLTGGEEPAGFHSGAVEELHVYRNLILTLAVAATGSVDGDLTSVLNRSVHLPIRTCASSRALADDETLLLRAIAWVEIEADASAVTPLVYALVDAGMDPGEIAHFELDDFEGVGEVESTATALLARGSAQLESRFLPLGCFGTNLIERFASAARLAGLAPAEPLALTGMQPVAGDHQSEVAFRLVIDRLLNRAGLLHRDVNATSIRRWRLENTYLTFGAKVAQEIGGYGHSPEGAESLFQAVEPSHMFCSQAGLDKFEEALD